MLSKILLESRAFTKEEMDRILNILKALSKDKIEKMISNDKFNYTAPRHNRNIIDFIWDINYSIRMHREVKVKYRRQDDKIKEYYIRPLGLVFNEYYFYVIGPMYKVIYIKITIALILYNFMDKYRMILYY